MTLIVDVDTPPLLEHDPALRLDVRAAVADAAGDLAVPTMMDLHPVSREPRFRVGVWARKIPRADRDVARALMPDGQDPWAACKFRNVLGADTADDDVEFPAGTPGLLDGALVYYSVMATATQIETMRAASNAVSVQVQPLAMAR